jgi:hypothetical protein
MANELSQVSDKNKPTVRKSVNLLPVLFKTDKNSKFLAGTLDQLIQPPQLKRVDGWVGSKITPTFNIAVDNYLTSNSKLRQDYQVEPALVVTNDLLKVTKTTSYDDLINQLAFEGANVSKLDRLFDPKFYSYDPHIDWDKFINFEKYYWLPNGPDAVVITDKKKEIVSTYSVTDTADGNYFVFSPDGLTPIPQITLYRGVTYKFNINSSKTFWIKTDRVPGKEAPFRLTENNGIKNGTVTLTIDNLTPNTLYFVSEESAINGGQIVVKKIEENTFIDVEKEIIGKKNYTSTNGIELTNGLKIKFIGTVVPEIYAGKEFVVEGVGDQIKLIDFNSLSNPEKYAPVFDERYDSTSFDSVGYDQQSALASAPDYITINRASQDRNAWSRYNRWFHEDVITVTAKANKVPLLLPLENRAKRPIVEFRPNLQLYNYGSVAKDNVQFIDTTTKDVFSNIEGQLGYYVDGEELGQGDRIIFTADEDSFVNGKTFIVHFININGKFRINLEETEDVTPQIGDSITVTKGTSYKGSNWWYNGTTWVYSQQKEKINQAPKFEIYDINGVSYSERTVYDTLFAGSNVFGYEVGTGPNDPVLGFPLSYKNIANQGYYLFKNYFMTDRSFIVNKQINVSSGYLRKIVNRTDYLYVNVWADQQDFQIPVLQYQIITEEDITDIEITAVSNAGYQTLDVDVFVDSVKKTLQTDYTLYATGRKYYVVFKSPLAVGNKVFLKIRTTGTISETGIYETSIGWTNNPLNGPIGEFTLSELSDHVKSMVDRHPDFRGTFPGKSNIRDLKDLSSYGTRLISNQDPLAFAGYFVANDEFNLISATRLVGKHYNQFKLGLIDQISKLAGKYTPVRALDIALYNMNVNKDSSFPYAFSDMLGYGTNATTKEFPVTDSRNKTYSLLSTFSLTKLSTRSVIVYRITANGTISQLLSGIDYEFDPFDTSVHIKIDLVKGDTIRVDDYPDTTGCFVPPTPTKLGLYPKFAPRIYLDNTYAGEPQMVIEGHDGSIMLAYGDDRDEIILEYERRVFNNIKTDYNPHLLNIDIARPGAFRKNEYTPKETNDILSREFLKWDAFYGFNYSNNTTTADEPKTWNFRSGKDFVTKLPLPGNWRAIYKYFFDTDRPHTHPWEMLGFPIKPTWWDDVYGVAPYTRGNEILWDDLERGVIRDPAGLTTNSFYARPGLSNIIPVNESGNLLMPNEANIATDINYLDIDSNWKFGDMGPVETAWRRSSHYPFAVQILLALTKPALYSSLLFDVSRMKLSPAGQYVYGDTNDYISFDVLKIYQDTVDDSLVHASGYSVFLIEAGKQKNKDYVNNLKKELGLLTSRLSYKAGGFINKDKFKIIIDSVSPNSSNPGVSLSNEDYEIFLDKSSPVKSLGVSGVIVQKTNKGYSIRGYDTKDPYFTCLMPIFTAVDPAIVIGGKAESYVSWAPSSFNPMSGLDTTSVSTNSGYRFYRQGQVVEYENLFYRCVLSHNAGTTFNAANFQRLTALPVVGGVTVRSPRRWETTVTEVSYGTEYENVEDLYAVLIGYGRWLESQGLIFDEFNSELGEVLDWTFTSKEAIYWATQNWAVDSVITLSPFAASLKFSNSTAVVDDLTNIFYEYSVLKADGTPLSSKNISTAREENLFNLKTTNTTDGIYFVRLNLVQKEHTLVLDNTTQFNDVIYDIDTGYRQRRIKLLGFITDNWNGDIFSPGFVYDEANISSWAMYKDYTVGDVVFFSGNYYVANTKITGTSSFDYNHWNILGEKPVAQLLPNFDYKISQFEDFYSLDIDNFDISQQELAQHLVGYSPRRYLDNIFVNSIAQYKFYQGFIKEKGTRNTIDKLGKASIVSQGSYIDFYENWALRIGEYGSFPTRQTIEFNLDETKFKENPQIVKFVDIAPTVPNEFINYKTPSEVIIKPDEYNNNPFVTTSTLASSGVLLPVAGYVRLDDVTATAFNNNSLLDIANNRGLKDGDTVWIGFKPNGNWDVARYSQIETYLIDAAIYIPGESMLLTTDYFHGLRTGDLISVSQFDSQVDGIYTVEAVPELNQVVVSAVLTDLTIPFSPGIGLIFKFISSRFESFDDLASLPTINRFEAGEKVWIDNTITDTDSDETSWAVYKKVDNFTSNKFESPYSDYELSGNQRFGFVIAGNSAGTHIAISSPNYRSPVSQTTGRIYTYRKTGPGTDNLTYTGNILPNLTSVQTYFTGTNISSFGSTIKFDSDNDIIIAGAPLASGVRYSLSANKFSPVSSSSLYYPPNNYAEQGFVLLTRINFEEASSPARLALASPEPQVGAKFGSDIFLGNVTASQKLLFVSSPGQDNVGAVYYTKINVASLTSIVDIGGTATNCRLQPPISLPANSKFGSSIGGNQTGSKIAVAALGIGKVFVYSSTNFSTYTCTQTISITDSTISSLVKPGDNFGFKVLMSKDSTHLFISAPRASDKVTKVGKIFIYILNSLTGIYSLSQVIDNPFLNNGYDLGTNMDLSSDGKTLIVSCVGSGHKPYVTFDTYQKKISGQKYVLDPESTERENLTSFDSNTTKFYSSVKNSGAVFTFTRINEKYVYAENLYDSRVQSNQVYGRSVFASDSGIIVGAPGQSFDGNQSGSVYFFDSNSDSLNSWQLLRQQEQLVDLSTLRTVRTINIDDEQVEEYLEIIDPIKGKISGVADQELKYKSLYDPAVHSIGVSGVVVDLNSNWLDEHIGELWWDLSSVKYLWYEQGELEFRKNNWNNTFPGSMIDVYEWVRSPYLPSQWSLIADTNEGLAQGISGQPKFADNSVLSVKQVWDPVSNSFSNMYYYWVKNKITIPTGVDRKISVYNVAALIADPKAQGVKFASIISSDALMLTNIQTNIFGKSFNLSVDYDTVDNSNNKHTEWLLVQENNSSSVPPSSLVQKMVDSMFGRDRLGNLVPDLSLPSRLRYGTAVRPRQTLFKDRFSATRVAVEYINSVFASNNIVGFYNLDRFNSKDEIPNSMLGEYDFSVEDLIERDFVLVTRNLKQAQLRCEILHGRISNVIIVDPGYGYGKLNLRSVASNVTSQNWIGPTVKINGDQSGAIIQTEVNAAGEIVAANIINPGSGFVNVPALTVRPFTVIVQADSTVGGKWSKYVWNYSSKVYERIYTQSFDTTLYWKYIDWVDTTFDHSRDYLATIEEVYQLPALGDVPAGNYVKINNSGDGRYQVLRKILDSQTTGNFNSQYDLVYQEKGTVKISDALWDSNSSIYGWDQTAGWDQTNFDQTPDKESENIILGVLTDIFVRELDVYYNKLFFKLVKYALTEQKFIDWAFKTSIIDVINYSGALDQRPFYKLNNESYYQDYVNETKPYHTKIRNFTSDYTATDVTRSITTDFDLPSIYNGSLKQFTPITFGSPYLGQYPWKSWSDNYGYSVDRFEIFDGGSGYTNPPVVEITPQPGDTGSGAKATAYIALGKVSQIIVTDPGSGYTATPKFTLLGGGPTTLTPAKVSIRMTNNRIRSTGIHLKFDRVSGYNEVNSKTASDSYISTGQTNKFKLTWAPNPDKNFITVKVNGLRILSGEYTITQSTTKYKGYTKKIGYLSFDTIPRQGLLIEIEYRKDLSLYHAVDRIRDYYEPTDGMPGNTATLLMSGLEYPGVTIEGIPLGVSQGFDTLPFGSNNWDDFVPEDGLYEIKGPKVTARVVASNSSLTPTEMYFDISANSDIKLVEVGATLSTGVAVVTSSTYDRSNFSRWKINLNTSTSITVGSSLHFVNPNPLIYTLPYVPSSGERVNVYAYWGNNSVRLDGATGLIPTFVGNGFINTISLTRIYDSTATIAFRLETSDGSAPVVDPDFDTYVSGGGYYTDYNGQLQLTRADDLEDISLDGDKFVSTTNSYGPEENIPGKVSDTLGINVFTYNSSTAATVVNKKYITDGQTLKFAIGATPPTASSVEVILDGELLNYGTDYNIDFVTNEVVLLQDPALAIIGPYFSSSLAQPKGPIGSAIASTAGDDTFTGPYPLGFEWNMFGQKFTQVHVGTNGYITFGGGDSQWTPLKLGQLIYPAIYIEYCDLWQAYGLANNNTTPLSTGEIPGLFFDTGTVGDFTYWRLRFQGSHYNQRNQQPTIPAYQYEVTLYSDGTNQYIEMIYENTWRNANFNGDLGFITGVALGRADDVPGRPGPVLGAGIEVDYNLIQNNTSHVFYSTANGGDWKYAGRGSFDAFKNQTPTPQILSITTMNVGGQYLLSHEVINVTALTGKNNFEFLVRKADVKSAYITVNGVKRTDYTITGTGRAVVNFTTNLVLGDIIQIWLFAGNDKAFSEINEQIISASTGTTLFTLTQPPGNIAPLHNQVIVERNGVRLLPPDTVYYIAKNGQRRFSLEAHIDYPQGLPDKMHLEVYVNGIRRPFNQSLRLRQDENLIEFSKTAINDGDAVAVSFLWNHDYTITGSKLALTSRVNVSAASTIKVTSFTNHDNSLFRRERFKGTGSGQFKLTRPVLSIEYVWVEVNGIPLVRDFDYRLDRDLKTVILNDRFNLESTDSVVIMSVTDQVNSSLVGYRMFQDNIGRTHYKRLSQYYSTRLALDLYETDTTITVEDASSLSQPDSSRYRPGIILINGERIEFMGVAGNKLTQIRRGTLGTGVKTVHKESSLVIDQGTQQTIPVTQKQAVWNTSTSFWSIYENMSAGTSTYLVNNIGGLSYNEFDVFYQGRRLRKPETVFTITNTTVAYDSDETNSSGQTSNVTTLPEFRITGTNTLILDFLPVVNSEIKVITKTVNLVGFEFSDIHKRNVEQVNFLLETPSFVPDKYYYGQNVATNQYIVLEAGDTLNSETGDPLIGQ